MNAAEIAIVLIAKACWWISSEGIRLGEVRMTGREARMANILAQGHFVRIGKTPEMTLEGREIKVSWK